MNINRIKRIIALSFFYTILFLSVVLVLELLFVPEVTYNSEDILTTIFTIVPWFLPALYMLFYEKRWIVLPAKIILPIGLIFLIYYNSNYYYVDTLTIVQYIIFILCLLHVYTENIETWFAFLKSKPFFCSKKFILFCFITSLLLWSWLIYSITISKMLENDEIKFDNKMNNYISNHPDQFVKEETDDSKGLDPPRDDIKWIEEKFKEYPENLSNLINNPKPEKINYIIGNTNEPNLSTEEIVRRNLLASVMVLTDESEYSYGTGFIIDSIGIIATSYHIFGSTDNPTEILGKRGAVILSDNKSYYSIISVLYIDIKNDLIILKIDGKNKKFPTVKIGNSSILKPGQKVVTIGNSNGFLNTVFDGLVSGFKNDKKTEYIQISNPVEGGNSGGAVFNNQGQVVGVVNSSMRYSLGINFATPINYLKELMNKK